MLNVLFFNQDDTIFHRLKGASEDSDCIHLGVCQVAGVKVAGCHIGLELLMPTNIGARCNAGIEEPIPRFGVYNVADHLSNFCSIISVTYLNSWVEISFRITQCPSLGLLARILCAPPGLCSKESLSWGPYPATATLLLFMITYTLFSAGRRATVRNRGFLCFALSASIKWGGAVGRLMRIGKLKLLMNI